MTRQHTLSRCLAAVLILAMPALAWADAGLERWRS